MHRWKQGKAPFTGYKEGEKWALLELWTLGVPLSGDWYVRELSGASSMSSTLSGSSRDTGFSHTAQRASSLVEVRVS